MIIAEGHVVDGVQTSIGDPEPEKLVRFRGVLAAAGCRAARSARG